MQRKPQVVDDIWTNGDVVIDPIILVISMQGNPLSKFHLLCILQDIRYLYVYTCIIRLDRAACLGRCFSLVGT